MERGYYKIENRAKRYYGTTEIPEFAGYLLTDGSMLNFSCEGYQRDEDHRNISQFFKTKNDDGCFSTYMYKFMRRGNIRVSCSGGCYGLEFIKTPTRDQLYAIRSIYRTAEDLAIPFIIEKALPDYHIKTFDFDDFMEYMQNKILF